MLRSAGSRMGAGEYSISAIFCPSNCAICAAEFIAQAKVRTASPRPVFGPISIQEKCTCDASLLLLTALTMARVFDVARQHLLRSLQLLAAARAEIPPAAVDEVCEHAHPGARSLRRDFLRSQCSCDGRRAFREQTFRWMRGVGLDCPHPLLF